MQNKISIIIVNYNSGNYLLGCLTSIRKNLSINYEVIIVDNNSQDNSFKGCQEMFSELKNFIFIQSGSNLGFSKGNNLGIKHANGSIFHFLNPDTELSGDMNKDYQRVLSEPDFIYVNPLRNPDGKMVKSEHLIPTIGNYFKALLGMGDKWFIGASVIISKENYSKIKGWNEQYWMYYEDVDLFYKINKKHLKIIKLPAIIEHIGGGCSSNVWSKKERNDVAQNSKKRFYKINRLQYQYRLINLLHEIYDILLSLRAKYNHLHSKTADNTIK